MPTTDARSQPPNTPRQVLFASLIGTTVEFFDFYIYATAAVLVFPRLFFPPSDPAAAALASLATFGVAFLARPVGAVVSGQIERLATGNQESMRNLGQDRIRQIAMKFPPCAEQPRIVAEVERRLSVVEELEATVAANLQRAARLRPSILQRAFSGRL